MPDPTPQPTPAAPDIQSTPPAAPDLSSLTGPAPATPTLADAVQTQVAPIQQEQNTIASQIKGLAQPAAPTPPPPHARLLAMVSGLALGLDAFGKSIATQGKEGGATEVQQVRGEQQRQQIEKQQAAQAAKNAQIQQLMTVYDTNQKQMQSIISLATLKNQMTESDLNVVGKETEIAGAKQAQQIQGADFAATHGGMDAGAFLDMMNSKAPITGTNNWIVTQAKQELGGATKVLGANDPAVKGLQDALSNPSATPRDLYIAKSLVESQRAQQDEVVKEKSAQEQAYANSPVGKLSTPEALADPGAKAAIQAKIADPKTDPNDIPALKTLLSAADTAQNNKIALDRRQKQMEQDIQNGDPNIVGQELASGLFAPSQVLSSRSMSKPFYSAVLKAADDYGRTHGMPELKDENGKPTGHYYNGAQAEAQFKFASNNQTQNILNMVDALGQPGGVADILIQKGKGLANVGVPVFNSWDQALSYQTGGKGVPAYMPAAVDFADMYAKIMGSGGAGANADRVQAINLIMAAQTPEQRQAAVDTLKETLVQRGKFIVRDNPFLRSMYPTMGQGAQTPGPIPQFQPDTTQPPRPANVPANQIHGNGPHGMGWYDPAIFGGK